jgi:hypothetical protein
MSGNTAKIVDFEAFRTTRQRRAPLTVVETAPVAEAPAPAPAAWPVYWVYFPAIYVSGF